MSLCFVYVDTELLKRGVFDNIEHASEVHALYGRDEAYFSFLSVLKSSIPL